MPKPNIKCTCCDADSGNAETIGNKIYESGYTPVITIVPNHLFLWICKECAAKIAGLAETIAVMFPEKFRTKMTWNSILRAGKQPNDK